MNDKAFTGIVAGMNDAIAFAKGDGSRGRIAAGIDVKAIRAKTGLSQSAFALRLHIHPGTIRNWEQGIRCPDKSAQTLLAMVDADPDAALSLLDKIPN